MPRRLIAVLGAVVLAAASLAAHVSVPAEFKEIVSDSSLIVRGRVTDVRAMRIADGGVESIATFQVASVLKGNAESFVSVRVPGGVIGRYRFTMTGAPRFAVNEQAVVFLKRDAGNNWRLVGLSQGVYRVQPEARTGRPMIEAPVIGGRTAAATGQIVRGDTRRKPMAVTEFDSLVRLVVAGQGRGVGR